MTDAPRRETATNERRRAELDGVMRGTVAANATPAPRERKSLGDRIDDLIHYAIVANDASARWINDLNAGARFAIGVLMVFGFVAWTDFSAKRIHAERAADLALQTAIGAGLYLGSEDRVDLRDHRLNGLNDDKVSVTSILDRPDLLRIVTQDVRGRRCDVAIVIDGPRTHPAGRRCDLRSTK